MAEQIVNLLQPPHLPGLYIHQLRQTIQAYSPAQIALGEAMQNAIDAVTETGGGSHRITLGIDFDERTVSMEDDGIGFPDDISLLFLGGSRKREGGKKLFGLVGVGIKVVLFNSDYFKIRSRTEEGAYLLEIRDAHRFTQDAGKIEVPASLPVDPSPRSSLGTEIVCRFPEGMVNDPLIAFVHGLVNQCLPRGPDRDFGKIIKHAVDRKVFPNRFSALLAAFLRRLTYAGDILNKLGGKNELKDTRIHVNLRCTDPVNQLGEIAGGLFDGKTDVHFEIEPIYLLVEDVVNWVPVHDKPGIFHEALGRGGHDLSRTYRGFDVLLFSGAEDYEKLITDEHGNLPEDIEEYRNRLFSRINGIILTIGRVPHFNEFLPGGSRRVLSANGVVTTHDLDITKGRNILYLRCFDMVIDVDATLNYGKTQITDHYLVNRVRRFANDSYESTIQQAAANWVGRIQPEAEETLDVFLRRSDLGLQGYALQKVPTDENDVIALFFELAGRGYFPGYRLFGLSQMDKYDARAVIRRTGDSSDPLTPSDERQLLVLEFKVEAASIVRDFEREEKSAGEIHLLVAWNEGTSSSARFGFADIDHSRYYPARSFPRVQRYLEDTRTGAQVQVLLLKPIVQELLEQTPQGE